MSIRLASAGFIVVFVCATLGWAQPAAFQGLGDLPGGAFSSSASAISLDGCAIVGASDSGAQQAFLWTAQGGMSGLGFLCAENAASSATAVGLDGTASAGASCDEAFAWAPGVGMQGLGHWPGTHGPGQAACVSVDGLVVGGSDTNAAGSGEAFRWTAAEGMTSLGFLPNASPAYSNASAMSADGRVIVGYGGSSHGLVEGFRWTAETGMVGLGDLPGGIFYSMAYGISADGDVIVGKSVGTAGGLAFRWTQSQGLVSLGDLPGGTNGSGATSVSANGAVIVGYADTGPSVYEAFIWDQAHGIRNLREVLVNEHGLNLAGWTLTRATGISGNGRVIVGYGTNPSGQQEGWIARLAGWHAPWILEQPERVDVEVEQFVTFSTTAFGGLPPTYQWYKDGVPLAEDERVTGTATPTLSIYPTVFTDTGHYQVVVTNASGSVASRDAMLRVTLPGVCLADANCDGEVNWRDIEYFVAGMNDNRAAWYAMFPDPQNPGCPYENLDVSLDDHVTWRDISPFVEMLGTTCR